MTATDRRTGRRRPAGTRARFEHALNVWCGFGTTREAAREPLATQMQDFYQMPFEPFERYSPYGTPEEVAEFLSPYIEAGCSAFNVIPCAERRRDRDRRGRRASKAAHVHMKQPASGAAGSRLLSAIIASESPLETTA